MSRNALQQNLDNLVNWSEEWLLRFNSIKCKVLHFGKNNLQYEYFMKMHDIVHKLNITLAEKDLGVTMDPSLNFDVHINDIVKRANTICRLINQTIVFKSKHVMIPLFKSLVRPILEYANPVWCPYLKKTYPSD